MLFEIIFSLYVSRVFVVKIHAAIAVFLQGERYVNALLTILFHSLKAIANVRATLFVVQVLKT
jgi:hypothetical protein